MRETDQADFHGTRSSRISFRNDGWFITTREEIEIGPHATEFDAKLTAGLMATQLGQCEAATLQRQIVLQFAEEYGSSIGNHSRQANSHDAHDGPLAAATHSAAGAQTHNHNHNKSRSSRTANFVARILRWRP